MANLEHVELVRRGAAAIATWREAHPQERLDLSNADLRDVDLRMADLSGAILREAWLLGADLSWANLSESDLSGADLCSATLRVTEVWGANLAKAVFGVTSINNTRLSCATGLADAEHKWKSSIGVDTLVSSFRETREGFTDDLRSFFVAAGVPEELLKELPRILGAVRYYSCFICYGQHDVEFAGKLREDLRTSDVQCWLWDKDKTIGQRTQHEIEQKLDQHEKMVVLCSVHSLLADGVRSELYRQWAKDPNKLIPVSLEEGWRHNNYRIECMGVDLKPFLIERNYADFANKPYLEALAGLLRSLRRQPETVST